jgi:hypothetical protein
VDLRIVTFTIDAGVTDAIAWNLITWCDGSRRLSEGWTRTLMFIAVAPVGALSIGGVMLVSL